MYNTITHGEEISMSRNEDPFLFPEEEKNVGNQKNWMPPLIVEKM